MKKFLPLSLLLVIVFISSCSKSWMEDRIEGTWQLKSAERTSFVSWKTVNTGYESGRFTFNPDGTAFYTDNNLRMEGDWIIRRVRDLTNYDDNNDDVPVRNALSIHLYDFANQDVLNLEFDEMRFWGKNRLVAQYQTSGYRFKYVFER